MAAQALPGLCMLGLTRMLISCFNFPGPVLTEGPQLLADMQADMGITIRG